MLILFSSHEVYGLPYIDIDVVTTNDMITNSSYSNLVILDVRNQTEYDKERLDGAILIPVIELESRIAELAVYKDSEILVYCRTGVRSSLASSILDSNNFTMVFNMIGGISAWKANGYPTITTEFPSWIIVLLFMITIVLGIVTYQTRMKNKKSK